MTQHGGSGARSIPGRLEFERAIRRSDLPPPSRHLALTIATWADMDTGVIPERFQPSLSTLEEATGMGRKTVRTHLNNLEDRKWLERHRPDQEKARTEHARTRYALAIPPEARGGEPLGLGAEGPQPRGADTPAKGRRAPRARGGEPPKSPYESRESQDSYSESASASSEQQQAEPDPFDAFWSTYPRKIAKPKARTAWTKALKGGADPEHITAAAAAHATAWRAAHTETQFIPHPATWLNGARYDDESEPATPNSRGSNGHRGPYRDPDDQNVYDGEIK